MCNRNPGVIKTGRGTRHEKPGRPIRTDHSRDLYSREEIVTIHQLKSLAIFTMKLIAFNFLLLALVLVNMILESECWVATVPAGEGKGGGKKVRVGTNGNIIVTGPRH